MMASRFHPQRPPEYKRSLKASLTCSFEGSEDMKSRIFGGYFSIAPIINTSAKCTAPRHSKHGCSRVPSNLHSSDRIISEKPFKENCRRDMTSVREIISGRLSAGQGNQRLLSSKQQNAHRQQNPCTPLHAPPHCAQSAADELRKILCRFFSELMIVMTGHAGLVQDCGVGRRGSKFDQKRGQKRSDRLAVQKCAEIFQDNSKAGRHLIACI